MAVIPRQVAKRTLEVVKPPTYPVLDATAKAVTGFGATVEDVAQTWKERQEKVDRFNSLQGFSRLGTSLSGAATEALATAPPDGAGYLAGMQQREQEEYDRFIRTVPAHLRPEFEQRLETMRAENANLWASVEDKQTREYQRGVLTERTDNARVGIMESGAAYRERLAAYRTELREYVETTTLSPAEKAELLREGERALEQAAANARLRAEQASGGGGAVAGASAQYLASRGEGLEVQGVNPAFASRLQTALTAAEAATGTRARVNDLYRDPTRQAQYYANYTQRPVTWEGVTYQPGERGGLAAPPGQSRHQRGQAADIASGPVLSWLQQHAGEYGLEFLKDEAFRRDPGHIQMAGGGGGAGGGGDPFAGDPDFQNLTYEDRIVLLEEADRQRRVNARQYEDGLDDETAWIRAGNAPTGRYNGETATSVLGNTEAAAGVQHEINQAIEYAAAAKAIQFASPEELALIAADATSALSSPDNFVDSAKQAADILGLIEDRQKAVEDDPARYVMQDRGVAAAYGAMIQAQQPGAAAGAATAATRAYSASSLSLQDQMGIPESEQRLLPDTAVAAIAETVKVGTGQNVAQTMRSLAAQWGSQWPRVFEELSEDLPGVALVVGNMDQPDQMLAAERLAEAAKVGREAYQDTLPAEKVTRIREALPVQLEDFAGTLAATPQGGGRTFTAVSEAVRLLALSYARDDGDSGDRAVERAVEDIIGKKYQINGTFRVPREFDVDKVSHGAAAAQAVATGANWDVPVSLIGLTEEEARASYVETIKAEGHWVTSPDETGLSLYEPTTRSPVTIDGEPMVVPFAELEKYARARFAPSATGVLNQMGVTTVPTYGQPLPGPDPMRSQVDVLAPPAVEPAGARAVDPGALSPTPGRSIGPASPGAIGPAQGGGLRSAPAGAATPALTPEALAVMSPEAVAALTPEAVGRLAPATISTLPPAAVGALRPEAIARVTPVQAAALTPAQTAALQPAAAAAMTPAAVGRLQPAAIAAMPAATAEALAAVSPAAAQRVQAAARGRALTPAAAAAVTPVRASLLTPDTMAAVSPAAMAEMKPEAFAALAPRAVAALTPEATAALTASAMAAMTARQAAQVTPAQAAALTPEAAAAMKPAAVSALTPAAAAALRAATPASPAAMGAAPARPAGAVAASPAAAVEARPAPAATTAPTEAVPARPAMRAAPAVAMTPAEAAALQPAAAAALQPAAVMAMSPAAVAAMQPATLAALPVDTAEAVAAVSPAAARRVQAVSQGRALSPTMAARVTPSTAAALTPDVMAAVSPQAAAAFRPEAVAALKPDALGAMSPEAVGALTPASASAMTTRQAAALTPEAAAALTPAAREAMRPAARAALPAAPAARVEPTAAQPPARGGAPGGIPGKDEPFETQPTRPLETQPTRPPVVQPSAVQAVPEQSPPAAGAAPAALWRGEAPPTLAQLPPETVSAIERATQGQNITPEQAVEEVWHLAKQLANNRAWSGNEPPALETLPDATREWVWDQLSRRAGTNRRMAIQLRGREATERFLQGEVRLIWERWRFWREQGVAPDTYRSGRRF